MLIMVTETKVFIKILEENEDTVFVNQGNSRNSCLDIHPSESFFAVGSDSGEITFFDIRSKSVQC